MRNPFGPLAWWEIRRLGRSRQLRQWRVGYVLTLLVVQFLTFLNWFAPNCWAALLGDLPLGLDALSQFGSAYHTRYVVAEAVLLYLLVPIVFIEPMRSAKNRQMLDLLRSSPLTSLEIISGLVMPRFGIVAGMIVIGWPILAMGILYGGVGLYEVVESQFMLLSLMMIWGAIGVFSGLSGRGGFSSYGKAYLRNAIYLTLLLCASGGWIVFGFEVGIVILLAYMASSIWKIRPKVRRPKPGTLQPVPIPTVQVNTQPDPMLAPPIEGYDPWMWKEQFFPRRNEYLFFSDLMVQILLWSWAGFEAMAIVIMLTQPLDEPFTEFVYGAFLVFGLYFVAVASIRTSLTVVREREQRTLETLLCLPVEPATILSAKWKASLHGYRFTFVVFAGMFVLACVLEWQRSRWMLGHGLQFIAWFILMNTLALWLSVRCRSSASALIQLILWGIASLVVPPLLAPLFGVYADVVNGMSFSAGWSAIFDQGNLVLNLAGAGIDTALSLLGAWLLWRDTIHTFERKD